jgi:hypothetical protein
VEGEEGEEEDPRERDEEKKEKKEKKKDKKERKRRKLRESSRESALVIRAQCGLENVNGWEQVSTTTGVAERYTMLK